MPAVLEAVKNNINNPEVVYLSLKILWKIIHYEV